MAGIAAADRVAEQAGASLAERLRARRWEERERLEEEEEEEEDEMDWWEYLMSRQTAIMAVCTILGKMISPRIARWLTPKVVACAPDGDLRVTAGRFDPAPATA
eukprot:tig00020554_g10870.t1